jgi:hypothetical protein
MTALLANVTEVSTTLFSIATTAVTTVVANPLLLVFFSIAIVGAGVGLFQRLRG